MTFLDKTFCASPERKNECGRSMTAAEALLATQIQAKNVSYAYFCGKPDLTTTKEKT